MPLFEFRCQSCSHEFEALVRTEERPGCPRCDSHHLEKLFSETSLPVTQGCPPSDAPPCRPGCCRFP